MNALRVVADVLLFAGIINNPCNHRDGNAGGFLCRPMMTPQVVN